MSSERTCSRKIDLACCVDSGMNGLIKQRRKREAD